MKRLLSGPIKKDLDKKIILLSGPRQSGKTTLSKSLGFSFDYLNFDSSPDRKKLTNFEWDRDAELIIFDEIHKMRKWKSWIKGVYDSEGVSPRILVTGSARLDIFKRGGDSLAGRHFSYRLHPFSFKEGLSEFSADEILKRTLRHGSFPEPFLNNDDDFSKRWRKSHLDVILREDLLDLEKIRDIKSVEIMIDLLRSRVGSTVSYLSLSEDLQVSPHTVKHWLQVLENLYVIFRVSPWSKNIARSMLKESKYYFYDTGAVENGDAARFENLIACVLLQELHFLEDTKGVRAGLFFLRNKEKQEVDFLTVLDNVPTKMIEVKWNDDEFHRPLFHFSKWLPRAEKIQLVYQLNRAKSRPDASMPLVTDFLSRLKL